MNLGIFAFIFLLAGMTSFITRPAGAQTAPRLKEYQFRERTSSGGETLKHVVYVPRNLKSGRKYPLVV
jgi:predicted peptidase